MMITFGKHFHIIASNFLLVFAYEYCNSFCNKVCCWEYKLTFICV